jgi:acetylornithine deacetylase/succinyl-diaminopimelate desuccinylase-like protein
MGEVKNPQPVGPGPGDDLEAEVVGLARDLIRIDTSNPPGNETPAAELLADYLRGAGIECELDGPDPERLNLIARLPGTGDGPSLMLMAHTDVVPAPLANWTVPPFDATLRDGHLVGRGAVDMKNELAARAVALAGFARSGQRPGGDVVLVAESDEERNTSDVGMSWLVRERPDLKCDFALNEGGGQLLTLADGRQVMTISVGEKKVTSLRLRVQGRSAHASVPDREENTLLSVSKAIDRLFSHDFEPFVSDSVRASLEAMGAPPGSDAERLAWAAGQHPVLADLIPVMTRMTITPTGLATYEPTNVLPPVADVTCDCRALPGQGEDDVRAHVAEALGSGIDYELEFLEPLEGGFESPAEGQLWEICERYLEHRCPGATLLPMITPGFTDSHWIRQSLGTVAYGIAPVVETDVDVYLESMHGADERLMVADLVGMTRFHRFVLDELAAG